MVKIGHYYENGQSFFRIYAPLKKNISIEIDGNNKTIELIGYLAQVLCQFLFAVNDGAYLQEVELSLHTVAVVA